MTLSLDPILARVPGWAGRPGLQATVLAGGLTNSNYRVDVGGESFVLRISGANTDLLGIDRENEHAATLAASRLGIAPEVVDVIRPEGYLVTRFLAGRPIAPDEMRRPETIARVAQALKQIHALPPIPGQFSPFRVVEAYERIARERGVTAFPANFHWLLDRMRAIEAAFRREPCTPCPCHNDLLNENFLDDDGRVRILDWEYAGMGDPAFDLANFAAHHGFAEEQDGHLLEAYYGQITPRRWARHRLMKIMSDFREAMWGVVQIGLSTLAYDFRGYAEKFFRRMDDSLGNPHCEHWLLEFH